MFVKSAVVFNVLFACCLFPALSHAWQSNGYKGTADASHVGYNLQLHGNVTSGPACKVLQITAQLADTNGAQVGKIAMVENWPGWGSRQIESSVSRVSPKKSGWTVLWISAQCYQP